MSSSRPVRIWDLPTRLFHWALLVCVIGSLVTVKLGGDAIAWHFRFGYAILALLIFRILWGLLGPRYARFGSFPPNPMAALRYLRSEAAPSAGHNPLGAFSVYGLLAVLLVQVGTGLFANDSIMWDGPLKGWVSSATSDWLTTVHRINRYLLLALIGLHLLAIAFYSVVRKESLIKPMIAGDRDYLTAQAPPPARDDLKLRALAFGLFAAAASAVAWLVKQAGASG